jgi:ubiquinone/menaquinone biosynthesis C-methylase UbiE
MARGCMGARMGTHADSVHDQFDPQAQAYLTSRVHAEGPDLAHAEQLLAQALSPVASALDVGCGAGHLAFRLAPRVGRVMAVDPSVGMLATVAQAATARRLTNLEIRAGSAESLPFEDASFDLVASRYSAHHWAHLEPALCELHRVAKPGGALLLIDALAPEDALADTHLQSIELLRDRSHVRNRSQSQWRRLLAAAGFELLELRQWSIHIEFGSWVERMRTPSEHVTAIRSLQRSAPAEVQRALGFEPDGSFTLQTGLFWARRGAP